MCNCTCDCSELEDNLDAMEDEVEEAEDKVLDYQCNLDSQKWYSQLIFGEIVFLCNLLELDLTSDDLLDFFSSAKDVVDRCMKLSTSPLGRLYLFCLAVTLLGCITSYAASKDLERYYLMKLNKWEEILDDRKRKYGEIEDELNDCYSCLTQCAACGEEFVDKEECGRACEGCGRWYCTNCFDEAIESLELGG